MPSKNASLPLSKTEANRAYDAAVLSATKNTPRCNRCGKCPVCALRASPKLAAVVGEAFRAKLSAVSDKLRAAQQLLLSRPTLQIQEVAQLSGYSPDALGQAMKRATGMTPVEFRKKYAKRR